MISQLILEMIKKKQNKISISVKLIFGLHGLWIQNIPFGRNPTEPASMNTHFRNNHEMLYQ